MNAIKQPNILFLQADQVTPFALGLYGNPLVKTPNIDRLAQQGEVFQNAYCNNPICASSRFGRNQPFFLAASFTHPHNPFTTQPEFWDLYDHEAINMPTVPAIPLEQRDPWSQRYHHLIRNDENLATDADVRNARHAYYGMCSYFDALVGRLLKMLDDSGLADDTVVLFTGDHGDMLGERGMWYKFNPYESPIRVPLVVSAPGLAEGAKEPALVSLLDLLPTILDLATDGTPPALIDSIDGHSLVPLLRGKSGDWVNEVMVEFAAEGTFAPALILRRGAYKYVYCETGPGLLFDLEADPHELTNLCEDPAHQALAEELRCEILARWDPVALKADVIASQKRRRFLQKVILTGTRTTWDFQPHRDAAKQYLRTGSSPTQVKGLARFLFVAPKPPDRPREV